MESFLTLDGVEHEVCGRVLKFYPASLRATYTIKSLAKPLLQAVLTAFSGVGQETGLTERQMNKADGGLGIETVVVPISAELAKVKIEAREKAYAALIDAALDPGNGKFVCGVIMDSLRDDYPRTSKGPSGAEVDKFMEGIDVPAMTALVHGVMKANRRVFDDPLFAPLRALLLAKTGRGSSPSPSGPASVQGDPAPAAIPPDLKILEPETSA